MNLEQIPKEMLDACGGVLDGKYKVYYTLGAGQFAK